MTALAASLTDKAQQVLAVCADHKTKIATAESCTGGLVSAALTDIPGSSAFVERGFVTYSNEAKAELLEVSAHLIIQCGAVSEDVARAMAEGALVNSHADASVAITGIAGPGGGTDEKPVGLVHFAAAMRGRDTMHLCRQFPGDRDQVRTAAALTAMDLLIERIERK